MGRPSAPALFIRFAEENWFGVLGGLLPTWPLSSKNRRPGFI